ncbi:MAG: AMP-binding protein, partial [Candidatus Binatia bacterium]
MSDLAKHPATLSPEQPLIRDRCFHSDGAFAEFPREEVEQSISARFEKIVAQYPNQLAIKTASEAVSYAELNAMANRLAHAIGSKRSRAGKPIGILLEKGVEQVATMLGVLKAGKFFVLLDTAFPQSRIAAILADSEADLVVSDRETSTAMRMESHSDLQLVLVESTTESDRVQDICLAISPDEIACISYTSGSTGQPKGVIQAHLNLLHEHALRTRSSAVNEHDRVALLTTGTSNAISNTFQALLTGATLCPFDVKNEGVHRLASWLVDEKISVCLISSSLFRSLCQTLNGRDNFPELRFLRLRSESAYKTDVA